MKKWSRIANEITGWLFLIMAFLFALEVLQGIGKEQPAIVVGGSAQAGVLFAVIGFGFLFMNRIEEIKYNSRSVENDEYVEYIQREEEKKQRNWVVIGIAVGVVLIILASLPLFM